MCCCRTPAPVVPTTPASLSRYCLVDVDSFPSPFSGELFGSSLVSLDPLPLSAAASTASSTMTQYEVGGVEMASTVTDSGYQRDNRLLTLAAAGLSPRTAAVQMSAPSNADNEVSSSSISGVLISDHQQIQHIDEPDIARYIRVTSAPSTLKRCAQVQIQLQYNCNTRIFSRIAVVLHLCGPLKTSSVPLQQYTTCRSSTNF